MAGEVKQSATENPFAGKAEEEYGEPIGAILAALDEKAAIMLIGSIGGPVPYREFMPEGRLHPELNIARLEVFKGSYRDNYLLILVFNRDPEKWSPDYPKYLAQFILSHTPYKDLIALSDEVSPYLPTVPGETYLLEAPGVA